MTVTLRPMDLLALTVVCHDLRAADAEECLDGASPTPNDLAMNTFRASAGGDLCRIVWLDNNPVAAVGAVLLRPNFYAAYAFGTNEWSKVVVSITRYIRRSLMPTLLQRGARRVEAISHCNHRQAHQWLRSLGAVHEGTLRHYGNHGADYMVFAWTRPDVIPS